FDARIKVSRSRRSDPPIELHDAVDRALSRPQATYHIDPQAIEVALAVLRFPEFDTGRHVQQVTDRRLAVFRALKARHIRLWRIIDRFDLALAKSDPNQHRC